MMPPARRSLRPAPRRAALVLGLAGALVLGLPVAQPRAHPHAWIDVTVRVYPEARHEIFNETNRDEVTADVIDWLQAHV